MGLIFAHAQPGMESVLQTSGNLFGLFIQILGFLIIFFLLIHAYSRLKPTEKFFSKKTKGPHKLDIIETKHLGNRQFIFVVAYEGERILLGVGPNGVQFLCHLQGPPEVNHEKNE